MSSLTQPKVLLDADVVSHFIKGEQIDLLNAVFPDRLAIVDAVVDELNRHARFRTLLPALISTQRIEVVSFPVADTALTLEFARLSSKLGSGESACLALARHRKDYIASSNLRDIKNYCQEHGIQYYTTMDIMHLAVQGGHVTEDECDVFIGLVKSRNSRLPHNTYQEYLASNQVAASSPPSTPKTSPM